MWQRKRNWLVLASDPLANVLLGAIVLVRLLRKYRNDFGQLLAVDLKSTLLKSSYSVFTYAHACM